MMRTVKIAGTAFTVAGILLLTGCAIEYPTHTPPTTVQSDTPAPITENKVTVEETVETTNAPELEALNTIQWTIQNYYPSTKIFIYEGPASAEQLKATQELVDTLRASGGWDVEEENNSTDSTVEVTLMGEKGLINIYSNANQTGINLQHANL